MKTNAGGGRSSRIRFEDRSVLPRANLRAAYLTLEVRTTREVITMEKTEQGVDAVNMMRLIRDELGRRTAGMTFEQQRTYVRKRLSDKAQEVVSDAGSRAPTPEGQGVDAEG